MDIEVKHGWYGTEIIITDDNVKICSDARETLYGRTDDGKIDYTNRLGEDVTDEVLNLFSKSLDTLACYRKRDYDSSDLIETLFMRLTHSQSIKLLNKLNEDYV